MLREAEEGAAPFAVALRRLRERAGLTQEELAERAGLTAHAVSALERGTRTRPYPHTVRSLADGLRLTEAERTGLVASVPSRRAAGRPQDRDAAATPAAPSGLVVPPTPLHGRDGDLTALTALVHSGRVRLVTLTGMGGVGKTRLAVALAAALAPAFPDGSVQLGLASVTSPETVLDQIGRALDLTGADGPDAVERVAAHVGRRRILLLLDNFEHLLDAAADVGRLVARCPALTVLVSSRAPLRVRGEHEYPVGPLALPPPGTATVEELASSPSGALVLERTRTVAPWLELTPAGIAALASLCDRLAGIPLALELATARLRLLAPTALLQRLDSVLDSATSARDLPPRQRTMRATLDWSHSLLSRDQQQLFGVLSAFRGGATLDALEHVVTASTDLPPSQVLNLLEQLVEHSMVVVRTGRDRTHRYTMLEPVAQYARPLLVGEAADRAERAHADYYRGLALAGSSGIEQADQVLWLDLLQTEEPNLLVAVQRSLAGGYPDVGGQIVWNLWLFWWLRGQHTLGRAQAELCLGPPLAPPVLARVNLTAACMSYAGGDVPACTAYWAEALRLGEEQRDAEVICKAVSGTGLAALAAGDVTAAGERFRRALPLCAEAGEAGVWMSSLLRVWLGTVTLLQGDPPGAVVEVEQGLRIARSRGDRLSTYVALYNLSSAAIAGGDHDRARQYLKEGIALSEQTADLANLAYFLDALAVVESVSGAHQRVAVLVGAAQGFREIVGSVYAYYVPDEALREAAEKAAREALGEDAYDDAVDVGRGFDLPAAVAFALQRDTKVASSGRRLR